MELEDCAFGLLDDIVCTDDPNVAFGDVETTAAVGVERCERIIFKVVHHDHPPLPWLLTGVLPETVRDRVERES
ncbi:MAG: hypothetical protein EBX39_10520 [Actinobacteria bacterium]|nr:hypothetical protein [Actinomycetota bacterium]